ncbi:hypothetical protein DYQ86_00610 [Acidobacteria bacterium AB60]|nr:hypothetical protein DYQ86_00610 [Acidobacteria bacterium AB60]
MSSASAFDWVERSLRPDRTDPYLRIQFVPVFVRDLDRSIQFFVERLGFKVISEARPTDAERRVAVAPPDGTALLSLRAPDAESRDYQRIGRSGPVVFLTDDVENKFDEWSSRGVPFRQPVQMAGGGRPFYAEFEDPDGNRFTLTGVDELTRAFDERRRALAAKEEADRRTALELGIAKQVQAKLFPQTRPALRTLEYTGVCLQARQIGGDYYDFLELGQQRLGFIVGDISGKGIAAALLMANLQANLRSQSACALDEPQRLLRSVNQLFYQNTADSAYATLFFAEYDDTTGRVRYANCGHLPGLLVRADGGLERLDATGTVLGLFKEWDCAMGECLLRQGDVLAIYTDGVTEAANANGEEFGEQRLIDALSRYRGLPIEEMLRSTLDEIQRFSSDEQFDDNTLILARHRVSGG